MPDENPFKHAYDPLAGQSAIIKCPKCGAADFDAMTNQYGVHRTCRKCKNQWAGGGVGTAPDHFVPPEVPAEDDLPLQQYTGASFRDPNRNIGGDE